MFTPEVELADVMGQQPTRLQASVNSFESSDRINLVSIFFALNKQPVAYQKLKKISWKKKESPDTSTTCREHEHKRLSFVTGKKLSNLLPMSAW